MNGEQRGFRTSLEGGQGTGEWRRKSVSMTFLTQVLPHQRQESATHRHARSPGKAPVPWGDRQGTIRARFQGCVQGEPLHTASPELVYLSPAGGGEAGVHELGIDPAAGANGRAATTLHESLAE